MKAYALLLKLMSFTLIFSFLCSTDLSAQMQGKGGQWNNGYCPMCGGMMGGQRQQMNIPNRLPAPKNAEWVKNFRQVYALEKLSRAQYEADSSKYGVSMPYHMIIWQENNHIAWEEKLFSAYGISSDSEVPPVKQTSNLQEAYEVCYSLETDLIPRYEWLIKNAGDQSSRDVLDFILMQTRIHATMFQHVMSMGGMGLGHGMMH